MVSGRHAQKVEAMSESRRPSAARVVVGVSGRLLVLLACAVGLCLVGTLDDRVPIAPSTRLLAETAAALALVSAGLHWQAPGGQVQFGPRTESQTATVDGEDLLTRVAMRAAEAIVTRKEHK